MLAEMLDDLRFYARKSTPHELIKSASALVGLAIILGIGGWWLLSVGLEVSDVALEVQTSRAKRGGAALTLFWILGGVVLMGLSLILNAMGLGLFVSILFTKRKP